MDRQNKLAVWLKKQYPHRNFTLAFAAADADFRRYFRASDDIGSLILMDAPPDKMSLSPYLKARDVFQAVRVPEIYDYDEDLGFMALEDLGNTTFLAAMQHDTREEAHKALLLEAVDALITLQKSSVKNVLPPYDEALLRREVQLFPEWYVRRELNQTLTFSQQNLWRDGLNILMPRLTKQASVYVHRDFIVRNLMLGKSEPGILDFQDAVWGPISYDLLSLTRDAFISWEEDLILDIVIRYWEKARKAGLAVPEKFDDFYKDYEWMGVQRHLKVIGIFARLYHRDHKEKYLTEIPRIAQYLRTTLRRYQELAPLYQLVQEVMGPDEDIQTGYTF